MLLFTASHAPKTLEAAERDLPTDARDTLLAFARRAVVALEEVQEGFFFGQCRGALPNYCWGDNDVSLEAAAARYLYHLRNATHGHEGTGEQQQAEYATLLANNTGTVPTDLPGLALLYLIELLAHPERLRRILTSRSRQ